jgi:rod shape-determining protein MreC
MRPWLRSLLNVTLVLAILLVLFWVGAFRPIELFLARAATPVSKMLYTAGIYVNPGYQARTVAELIDDYNDLEEELTALQANYAVDLDIKKENTVLREQLNFLTDRSYTSVGAAVIGRQVDPSENTLLISSSALEGINVGQPVITQNGILIGTIAEVTDSYSLVQLLTDSSSAIAATISTEYQSIGVVNGGFGVSVQMNLIPQNERIVPGDLVITSGLTKEIPRGLLIGSVESIVREAYQPFQRAVITPTIRLDKVTVVSVITSAK